MRFVYDFRIIKEPVRSAFSATAALFVIRYFFIGKINR